MSTQTINKTIEEDIVDKQSADFHIPTTEEAVIISNIINKFRNAADERNQAFSYFDGDTIVQYIEDSVKRFYTNFDEREDLEDWQARINDPFTRTKVLAILGRVVSILPIVELFGRGDGDPRKAQLLTDLYQYSDDKDDYEEFIVYALLEAIVKGTMVGYEGHERKEKIIRDIKSGDGDDIVIEETKEVENKLFGAIVDLEEFYPSSVGIRRIKDMPYCFWRKIMPFSKFAMDWSYFERAKLVEPNRTSFEDDESIPFYKQFVSSDVEEGSVELIRYYNQDTDEYMILANGTWLNPLKGFKVSPLPFRHKKLPFWEIRFDAFGSDFFYGKSLPDRLKSMQDILNVLTNMLLDQSFLTIFPPILTSGMDSIEDDYLRPGRRTPVDTQGLKLSESFLKLDLGTPSGWHQFILGYTRKIMEQASLDQVSSGQAGVGGRTTAEEIKTAAEGVASLIGLFSRFTKYGLKQKALLRGANILQFWTDKNSPMIEKILGEGGTKEMNDIFNIFEIENTVLSTGKRGTKIIELYGDRKNLPTKAEQKLRKNIFEKENNRKIEIVSMPGEYIRNFEFDVRLIPNPKSETTKAMTKALQLEKTRVYLSFFPELINKEELAAQTAEVMGDDPTKILKKEVFPGFSEETQKAANAEQLSPDGIRPQDATANNIIRGEKGGEQESMQMRDIISNMQG